MTISPAEFSAAIKRPAAKNGLGAPAGPVIVTAPGIGLDAVTGTTYQVTGASASNVGQPADPGDVGAAIQMSAPPPAPSMMDKLTALSTPAKVGLGVGALGLGYVVGKATGILGGKKRRRNPGGRRRRRKH
jgi:hypothetical protein